jgi:tetratricopeptide (TPR) repeat protein
MTARALRLAVMAAVLSLAAGGIGRAQDAPPVKDGLPEAIANGMGEARDLFRRGKYEEAAKRFHQYENELKYPVAVSQECFFGEAECYRLLKEYPRAADVYSELLKRFSETLYREQVLQHLFEIAFYWLEDTKAEMKAAAEAGEGKRPPMTLKVPQRDKSKPTFGQERRALGLLAEVRAADRNGPLAERCLFAVAAVKFFRHEYGAAGRLYEELVDGHPSSALAYPALKYAVLAKGQARGSLDRHEEVRKLVERARREYPAQAEADAEFFQRQLNTIEAEEKKEEKKK